MDALSTTGGLQGPDAKGVWLMREFATVLAKFDIVLGGILFLCTVIKWYVLKARIEANGWKSMNPCEAMTLVMYTIYARGGREYHYCGCGADAVCLCGRAGQKGQVEEKVSGRRDPAR